MVVHSNIDVPHKYTLCQLCRNVTQLRFIVVSVHLDMAKRWLMVSIPLTSAIYISINV